MPYIELNWGAFQERENQITDIKCILPRPEIYFWPSADGLSSLLAKRVTGIVNLRDPDKVTAFNRASWMTGYLACPPRKDQDMPDGLASSMGCHHVFDGSERHNVGYSQRYYNFINAGKMLYPYGVTRMSYRGVGGDASFVIDGQVWQINDFFKMRGHCTTVSLLFALAAESRKELWGSEADETQGVVIARWLDGMATTDKMEDAIRVVRGQKENSLIVTRLTPSGCGVEAWNRLNDFPRDDLIALLMPYRVDNDQLTHQLISLG